MAMANRVFVRSSRSARWLWFAWVAVMGACGDDDRGVVKGDGADDAEVADTSDVDVEVDTGPVDRHTVTATVDPPGVGALPGWILMNRYGRWETDSRGEVAFEVARSGLTLTLLLPPGAAADDPRVPAALVFATCYLDEETPPSRVNLGVRDGAAGLLMLDPRMSSDDPWLIKGALEEAYRSPAVGRLASALDARFDARGARVLWTDTEVLAALDAAVDEVARNIGWHSRWGGPGRAPIDRVTGAEVVPVTPLGEALVELTGTAGDITVNRLPLVPGVIEIWLTRVWPDQSAWTTRTDLFEAGLETQGPYLGATRLTGDKVTLPPLDDDGLYQLAVYFESGAAGEAVLGRAVAERAFVAPGTCESVPDGFLPAIAAERDCRRPDPAELAAGTRLLRIAEAVGTRALGRREAGDLPGLDPSSPWTPMRSPPAQLLRLAIGDAFTPRPERVGEGPIAIGSRVDVTGPRAGLPDTRLVLRDATGRRAPVTLERNGTSFLVPEGLAGALTLEADAPGGRAEVALGPVKVEVLTITPTLLDRPRAVRLRGRGFAAGATLDVGGQTVTLGEHVRDDEVTVELDPALVGVGVHPIGEATLTVPDALTTTELQPTLDYGGMMALSLSGLAPDSPVAVTVHDSPIPVVLQTRATTGDTRLLLDTSGLDIGQYELRIESQGKVLYQPITARGAGTAFSRSIEFFATARVDASAMLREAVEMASGTRPIGGTFRRINMGFQIQGQWHCPLDIEPDEFSYPAASCSALYERCDEGWRYDDMRDPNRWWRVTRPPGRGSTGVRCPVIPGPDSWVGLPKKDIRDTVATTSATELAGVVLTGPEVDLTLPEGRGGGMVVTAPSGGGVSRVALDVAVKDASGTESAPVLAIRGAKRVDVRRLAIAGRQGTCRLALLIEDSEDVQVDGLDVSGCDEAVRIVRSRRVRIGRDETPAVVLGALESVNTVASRDVLLAVRAGTRADPAADGGVLRVPTVRGVFLDDSEHVRVTGSAAGLVGDALVVKSSRGVRIGPFDAGIARRADGTPVVAGMSNTRGIRVEGASRDVRFREVTAVAAGNGIDIADTAEVRLERVALGGVDAGYGTGPLDEQPLGNFNGGLRVFGGEVEADGLVVSRNGIFGVGVFGGRARIADLSTTSAAAGRTFNGAQDCAVQVAGGTLSLDGAVLDGDTKGVCLDAGEVVLRDVMATTATVAVSARGGRVSVLASDLFGASGVLAQGTALFIADTAVSGEGVALDASDAPVVVARSELDAAVAMRIAGGPLWGDDLMVTGGVGLELDGEGGEPAVLSGGVFVAESLDLDLRGVGRVALEGTGWTRLSAVDRALRFATAGDGTRHIEVRGEGDVEGVVAGSLDVDANGHRGRMALRGGSVSLSSDGSKLVYLDGQDIGVATLEGVERLVVRASSLNGSLVCARCGPATVVDVTGAGAVRLEGGVGHALAGVTVAGGVTLGDRAEASLSESTPVFGDHLPRVSLEALDSLWPRPQTGSVVQVRGVPDRARVAFGRSTASGVEVVGWAHALGGRARLPTGEASLVGAVTARGVSGGWGRVGPTAVCRSPGLGLDDEARSTDLRWETSAGWGTTAFEVAACGGKVASVTDGRPRRVAIDGVEVATAIGLRDLAFAPGCASLVWVAGETTTDLYALDVATGVVSRLTNDAELERRPAVGPDGTVWFDRGEGTGLWTVSPFGATDVAWVGVEASSPAPDPHGHGVAFLSCDGPCRLAWLEGGVMSWLDTAAPGEGGPCEAAEPRWVVTGSGVPLLAYVRGGSPGQLVLATSVGVVIGALAEDVVRVR